MLAAAGDGLLFDPEPLDPLEDDAVGCDVGEDVGEDVGDDVAHDVVPTVEAWLQL